MGCEETLMCFFAALFDCWIFCCRGGSHACLIYAALPAKASVRQAVMSVLFPDLDCLGSLAGAVMRV